MRARRRGFTLIEAISALVLLSVAIPPMLWSLQEAQIDRTTPIMVSTARWLATEKLEDVIADRHSTTRGYSYLVAGNYAAESPVAGFTAYSRSVAFTETLADLVTPGSGYMTVTVTVSWTDGSGTPRSLAIATVLTEYNA